MARYALFGGLTFYPEGGWDDMIKRSDDADKLVDEARERLQRGEWTDGWITWAHVIDLEDGKVYWDWTDDPDEEAR